MRKPKCTHCERIPEKQYNIMKAPHIEGMKVSTVRKETKKFNQPTVSIFYKPTGPQQ